MWKNVWNGDYGREMKRESICEMTDSGANGQSNYDTKGIFILNYGLSPPLSFFQY